MRNNAGDKARLQQVVWDIIKNDIMNLKIKIKPLLDKIDNK